MIARGYQMGPKIKSSLIYRYIADCGICARTRDLEKLTFG